MHPADITRRLSTLSIDSLRRLAQHYYAASAQAADNPRSRYHVIYYRIYFEIERRKDNPRCIR